MLFVRLHSVQTVNRLSLVAGIIGSIGAIAFGIGIVFTIPIQGCILAVAYREVFGGKGVSSTRDETSGAEDAPPDEPIQPE